MTTGSTTTGRSLLRWAVRSRGPTLTWSSVLFAAHQAGEALVPLLIGVVIDRAVDGGTVGDLLLWLAVLVADFVMLSLTWRFGQRLAVRAAVGVGHDLRVALTERVLDARGGAETSRLPGELAALTGGDTRRLSLVCQAVPNVVSAFAALLVGGVALLVISVPLGLLVLLGSPLLLLVIDRLGTPLERRSAAQLAEVGQAAGTAADLVAGIRVLQGLGAQDAAIERYRGISRRSVRSAVLAGRAVGWNRGAVLGLNGLFLALVAFVGGQLALTGQISVGQLVSAVGLAQFLLEPLSIFGFAAAVVAQGRASAVRIAEVLAAPHAVVPGVEVPVVAPGALDLRTVAHGPLTGVDLAVAAGETVGIVADDAASAAALLDLLARRTDPAAGDITLDGTPAHHLDLDALRGAVLVSDHDTVLFSGTVADNVGVRAADRGAGPALTAAGADQVAEALPDGVHTEVGDRGRSLSGGQRQRVALARALAADPPVLVLHDPTTAVDSATEDAVAAGIAAHRAGRTTVLVTTSPALLAVTDRVVVLRDGVIARTGTHTELLASDPDYRATVLS